MNIEIKNHIHFDIPCSTFIIRYLYFGISTFLVRYSIFEICISIFDILLFVQRGGCDAFYED